MEVTIDEYGRIVIPKPIRDQLGLEAGTELSLDIEEAKKGRGECLTLRPVGRTSPLRREGLVLVHTGTTDEELDPITSVRRSRSSRMKTNAGSLPTANE